MVGCAGVHHGDGAVGNSGLDHVGVDEILFVEGLGELGGKLRLAGDFGERGVAMFKLPGTWVGLLFLL